MQNAVNRLREILEGRGLKVDIACQPQPTRDGFVSYHPPGKLWQKTVINVRERLVRYDDALVRMIRDAEREQCRNRKSGPD